MKVKEVIAELQKLNQEKEIWVIYDGFLAIKPIPDDTQKDQEKYDTYDTDVVLNDGDYIITAG